MTHIVDFSDDRLIEALQAGKLAAFPTETVYGIGARYDLKSSFDELVKVKRRPPDKPFTLMCAKVEDIGKYAYTDAIISSVICRFMPGPITLLLRPKEGLYPWVTLNSPTIGIRVPNMKELQDLISKVGVPLLVPSANKNTEPPSLSSSDAFKAFAGEIEYIVEGRVISSTPSTIVDLSQKGKIRLVRQGGLPFDSIMSVYMKGMNE